MKRQVLFLCTLSVILFQTVHAQINTKVIPYRKGTLWGYADPSKKIIKEPIYQQVTFFYDNTSIVAQGNKYGLINTKYAPLTECKYDHIEYVYEKIFRYRQGATYGLLSAGGKELTPPIYDEIGGFKGGYAVAKIGTKYGLLNTKGKVILPFEYEGADGIFSEGYALVSDGTGNFYINPKKKKLTLPEGVVPMKSFFNGLAPAYKATLFEGKEVYTVVIINNKGQIVADGLPFNATQMGNVEIFSGFLDGMAILNWNNLSMFLTEKGQVSKWYKKTSSFNNGMAAVVDELEYGGQVKFIDKNFQEVFALSVDDVRSFSDGFFPVQYNYIDWEDEFYDETYWYYIDGKGQKMNTKTYNDASAFENGLAVVVYNGLTGVIDTKGTEFWE